MRTLFPTDLPDTQWLEFRAAGFAREVSGVVFRGGQASCCVPLGGLGTGCIDLNTDGTLGRCSIFNTFVPHRELSAPFLALVNRGQVHALTTRELPGTSPDPADQAQAREGLARFAAALEALPPLQREAFLLHEEGGLSVAEIAQATQSNEDAAKSRLRYAMAKLRSAVDDG